VTFLLIKTESKGCYQSLGTREHYPKRSFEKHIKPIKEVKKIAECGRSEPIEEK